MKPRTYWRTPHHGGVSTGPVMLRDVLGFLAVVAVALGLFWVTSL